MGDYTVSGLFEISADLESVMDRLTSTRGISTWWSNIVDGSASHVADEFAVGFPDAPVPFGFTVTSIDAQSVSWLVGEIPPPWAGTTITFATTPSETDGTRLMFSHSGFEPDNEILPVVTPAWMAIVGGLKSNIEARTDKPFFVN